jgi:tetratricopeptide (TPR) repeat protein
MGGLSLASQNRYLINRFFIHLDEHPVSLMKKISILFLLINTCFWGQSFSQNPKDKLDPKTYFDLNDYNRALQGYLELWPKDQGNIQINRNIAICYLSVNDDRSKALPYLHFLVRQGVNDEEVIFMLGQAYMYAYKFDEALKYFNSFRSKTNPKNYEMADLFIAYCNNAKEMVQHPLNVTFENLGKAVNSKYPDYYPYVIQNEGVLYYTSRRETNTGNVSSWEGYYTSDIYYSKVVNGVFTKGKNLGTMVNTAEDEECVYVTPDGKNMIVYQDNARLQISGDLFLTSLGKGKTFPKPVGFDEPVNTNDLELEGCITADLKTVIISSDRKGGLGETDLYMLKQLPNGSWAAPLNLGPNVNTKYREAFPIYDEISHTLYFASEGPKSMGGFDIFKSVYDSVSKSFGPAINMGYPINSPEDNMEFTFAGNRRDGYISAVRPEGYGDLDLYKVTFNDVEIRQTILKGKVSTEDSVKNLTATVTLYDAATKEEIGSKDIDGENTKYIFLLKPGKYIIKVTAETFTDFKEEITIYDKSDYTFERIKDIVLLRPVSETKPDPKKGKKTNSTKSGK